jgi:AI-2 transport protein TqsA
MTATPRTASFARVAFVLAAVVIILAGMHAAAPILNPILFALVFSLILSPVYGRLRSRLATTAAIIVLLICLGAVCIALSLFLVRSIQQLTAHLSVYAAGLTNVEAQIQTALDRLGLSQIDLRTIVSSGAIFNLLGTILGGISHFAGNTFFILLLILLFLGEGPALMRRLRAGAGDEHLLLLHLSGIGASVTRQFALRALVNLATGAGVTVLLYLLGVDAPLLWGILTFFLSYIPYLGIFAATVPSVLLALAEFGIGRALLVIAGVTIINMLAENLLSPLLLSHGLSLSMLVTTLSLFFWTWLLGVPGAFLAMPITFCFVVILDAFPETRWLTNGMITRRTTRARPAQRAESRVPASD